MKLKENKIKKDNKMYYGKLEQCFSEICQEKSLNEKELKHQMIKDFVEKHKHLAKDKYYLKYQGDKDEILIYGDDGEYFELSDGSKMNKRVFEKMFKSEKNGEIEINPYDFFNHNEIDIKKVETPINMKDFDDERLSFSKNVKEFFDNIDTRNMKEFTKKHNINIKEPIWNNEPIRHIQSDEWNKIKKKG